MKTLQMLLLLLAAGCMHAYKPVILVHGVFSGPIELQNLTRFITKAHPGTKVVPISLFDYVDSLKPMWQQVDGFRKAIRKIMDNSPVASICCAFHKKGGVICRGVLSTTPYHNVHTFIALSSPLAGQYGETSYLKDLFPCLKKDVYSLCYNEYGQQLSVCNYWNDPHHRYSYKWGNNFLPLLNGERPHKKMAVWRRNFIRIKKMVLIGGPDDGVITPWQSSHFGFYNSKEEVDEMKNQKYYKDDSFGLKTLDFRGDISMCVRSGVKHTEWHSNLDVFKNCIQKWLI